MIGRFAGEEGSYRNTKGILDHPWTFEHLTSYVTRLRAKSSGVVWMVDVRVTMSDRKTQRDLASPTDGELNYSRKSDVLLTFCENSVMSVGGERLHFCLLEGEVRWGCGFQAALVLESVLTQSTSWPYSAGGNLRGRGIWQALSWRHHPRRSTQTWRPRLRKLQSPLGSTRRSLSGQGALLGAMLAKGSDRRPAWSCMFLSAVRYSKPAAS